MGSIFFLFWSLLLLLLLLTLLLMLLLLFLMMLLLMQYLILQLMLMQYLMLLMMMLLLLLFFCTLGFLYSYKKIFCEHIYSSSEWEWVRGMWFTILFLVDFQSNYRQRSKLNNHFYTSLFRHFLMLFLCSPKGSTYIPMLF